jgi:hypothetical protein
MNNSNSSYLMIMDACEKSLSFSIIFKVRLLLIESAALFFFLFVDSERKIDSIIPDFSSEITFFQTSNKRLFLVKFHLNVYI